MKVYTKGRTLNILYIVPFFLLHSALRRNRLVQSPALEAGAFYGLQL